MVDKFSKTCIVYLIKESKGASVLAEAPFFFVTEGLCISHGKTLPQAENPAMQDFYG